MTEQTLDTRKIRELREQLGLTQTQAADLAGLSDKTHWQQIESGRKTNVTIRTLNRIAQVLGVTARDLLK